MTHPAASLFASAAWIRGQTFLSFDGFVRLYAHNVPAVIDLHLLDLEVLAHDVVAPGAGEDLGPDLQQAPHLHPHDGPVPLGGQRVERPLRHHPPVAHHDHALDGEARPQQLGNAGQARDVGRVARPHLAGDRQPVPPHQHPDGPDDVIPAPAAADR